ncbi:glycine oxidase ThiO [Staphylococcus carnosus]|uniref:glycine oxidase n=1 Tax=Staphylococcus carnosus TaxID=1281 RepID=A0AAJ0JPV3_STACA|nr:glycine oxidase ThiO [Staphylococcus carnosus]KKB25819.1 glycine oxidase [Staphylococcus carnosus]PNZ99667.1 glycine oxidase ThiO [Staphylococcus carnosus]QQS84341.1 glycine oxidase ThiO [Staphylococcus carnosus]QRQ04281.1 glycine oxidase ThiO [Staphylococcus carnosus]UTB83716.1 glycine oxidase ThiO [Staphylococcus carnosus]
MFDLIIVGAGVIGMSIARHLKDSGMQIALIDRDIEGQHASYKAGGMLGAQNEFKEDSPLFRLALKSREKFNDLSIALEKETGIDIQYQQNGLIKIATNEKDIDALHQQYEFLHQHDDDVQDLSNTDLGELTHYLVKSSEAMMFVPHDHQINANHYTKALHASLKSDGAVTRFNHTNVENIKHEDHHYTVSIKHENEMSELTAEKVVVAAGAWAGFLAPDSEIQERVSGVKGEVLLVENEDLDLKQTLFMTNGCYIVPKPPNRFLIGATSYFDNYSVGVSTEGKEWLLREAIERVPELASSREIKYWSGVRPWTQGEQPIMDETNPGLWVITGHYRNGILLSPIIGELMAEWLKTDERPEELAPFKLRREKHEVHH